MRDPGAVPAGRSIFAFPRCLGGTSTTIVPEALPMPMAERGAFSPDGSRIAYTPIADAFRTWKHYQGGMTSPVWIFDMASGEIEKIPHESASDTNPLWVGRTVYFLSDRNETMNLFAYDTVTKKVIQVTRHEDYDVKSASAGGGVIAYEQAGRIRILDPVESGFATERDVAGEVDGAAFWANADWGTGSSASPELLGKLTIQQINMLLHVSDRARSILDN